MNQTEHSISSEESPLGTAPIGQLLKKFAIPSIISMLVGALYNIVDQIFIGQGVGMLGNAATNVAFPLTTISTAVCLLLGIGGAANYNLELGRKNKDKARNIAGTAFGSLIIFGISLCLLIRCFLTPLVIACGATEQTLPYSLSYVGNQHTPCLPPYQELSSTQFLTLFLFLVLDGVLKAQPGQL